MCTRDDRHLEYIGVLDKLYIGKGFERIRSKPPQNTHLARSPATTHSNEFTRVHRHVLVRCNSRIKSGTRTSPPEIMRSLLRSRIEILPSGFFTARSPVPKCPPRNAFLVAPGSRKYCSQICEQVGL